MDKAVASTKIAITLAGRRRRKISDKHLGQTETANFSTISLVLLVVLFDGNLSI
jgi:hypothetical protein